MQDLKVREVRERVRERNGEGGLKVPTVKMIKCIQVAWSEGRI